MTTTDERNIPEHEINEAVAKASETELEYYGGHYYEKGQYCGASWTAAQYYAKAKIWRPLTNHDQFHELMDPETQAKVRDRLALWFGSPNEDEYGVNYEENWWHHPDYKANERLWDLRALVAVLNWVGADNRKN